MVNTILLDKLRTPGYTPENDTDYTSQDNWEDIFVSDVTELKNELEADVAGGWPPCYVNCIVQYLDCVKNNPVYPPRAICDTYFNNCIIGCDGTPVL